jgi:hypothetical protein
MDRPPVNDDDGIMMRGGLAFEAILPYDIERCWFISFLIFEHGWTGWAG